MAFSGLQFKGKKATTLRFMIPKPSYGAQRFKFIVNPPWLMARLVEDEARSYTASQHQTPSA